MLDGGQYHEEKVMGKVIILRVKKQGTFLNAVTREGLAENIKTQ